MNSSETNPKEFSEKLSVELDGLRLVQTEQDYLTNFKAFDHQVESEQLIKTDDNRVRGWLVGAVECIQRHHPGKYFEAIDPYLKD